MQHISIIGGGFAGVWAALGAADARRALGRSAPPIGIRLVTREPYLTIRPRLYEPDPEAMRVALAPLLAWHDVDLVVGDATAVDVVGRTVDVSASTGGTTLPYDRLILTVGSRLRRPPVAGADDHAFAVDTYAEAVALDQHIVSFGAGDGRDGRFTAMVAGAGLAGLEVATTMLGRLRTQAQRAGSRETPRVILVERGRAVAPDLGASARPLVEEALRDVGIEVRLGTSVTAVTRDHVTLSTGEHIAAATTVWTAGLCAGDLTAQVPAERDDLGRLVVDDALRISGVAGAFAAGDAAHAMADGEHVAPMSCQYAIPMGDRAGRNAVAELVGRAPAPFRPAPYVTCIDLGPWGALFTQGWDRHVHLTGFWGKQMKETINTRMIYPPLPGRVPAVAAEGGRIVRPAA